MYNAVEDPTIVDIILHSEQSNSKKSVCRVAVEVILSVLLLLLCHNPGYSSTFADFRICRSHIELYRPIIIPYSLNVFLLWRFISWASFVWDVCPVFFINLLLAKKHVMCRDFVQKPTLLLRENLAQFLPMPLTTMRCLNPTASLLNTLGGGIVQGNCDAYLYDWNIS